MVSALATAGPASPRVVLSRGLLLVGALAAFWFALLATTVIDAPDGARRIDRMSRIDSATPRPPASAEAAAPVALPDDWFEYTGAVGSAWYAARFTLPAVPDAPWGVYLPNVVMNAAVYVNDELIGQDGRMRSPVTRNWSRPLFFFVPVGLLRAGTNRLQIRVTTQPPGTGLLGRLYLGPSALLAPTYKRAYWVRVAAVQLSIVGALTMAFFMLVLWTMRRQDRVYLWFGIGLLCWSAHNLNLVVTEPPLPSWLWVRLMAAAIVWVTICTAFYALGFLQQRRPRAERLLLGIGALCLVLTPCAPAALFHPQRLPLFEVLAITVGLYATGVMLGTFLRRRTRDVELTLVTILSVCMMSTGGYDAMIVAGVVERGTPYLLPYSAPVVIAGFGLVLLYRFASALRSSESLNATLEQRVAQKTRELERNYEQLNRYQRAQAVADERQRIVRDMHDGVGGRLASTLAAVDAGGMDLADVGKAVRDALDDLRLTIDSLDPEVSGLGQLLGMTRARLEQQLNGGGVALRWQVRPLPADVAAGPRHSLQMLRIVQEAVNNVLRHAGATTVCIRTGVDTRCDPPRPYLQVIDDGRGMDAAAPGRGRGLDNMRTRARAIGARLSIDSGPSGTRVSVLFGS